MRRFAFATLLLVLVATPVWAEIDPTRCACTLDQTERLLIIPAVNPNSPYCTFTVTVRNSANNPVNNAVVEVLVGGLAENRTKLCAGTVTTGYTNASGIVTFNIPGGGCMKGQYACVIRAMGIAIREYWAVMSPDYAGNDNTGEPGLWDLCVTLRDLPGFATSYLSGGASCHDYDNSGTVGLSDLSIFAASFNRCCAP